MTYLVIFQLRFWFYHILSTKKHVRLCGYGNEVEYVLHFKVYKCHVCDTIPLKKSMWYDSICMHFTGVGWQSRFSEGTGVKSADFSQIKSLDAILWK